MKLTPAQVGMRFLLGTHPLFRGGLGESIRQGRNRLTRITRQDFGYDAVRWHEYLWETDAGGCRWCRRSPEKWLRHVRAGMARPGWAEAVAELMAEAGSAGPG